VNLSADCDHVQDTASIFRTIRLTTAASSPSFAQRLRSADTRTLLVSRTRTNFSDGAFSAAGPRVWNWTSDSRACHTAVLDTVQGFFVYWDVSTV